MSAANPKLLEFADEERLALESMLVEFDQSWTEHLLAQRVRDLPPHSPLRLPALVEMVKIDLERLTDFRYLDLPDGAPPFRRAPRYVEATGELFFSATGPRGQGEEDLWVVKGLQPEGAR
jgi:hypothetical protein